LRRFFSADGSYGRFRSRSRCRWRCVVLASSRALLEEAGHEAIAVDLPGDDEQAGLAVYADRVVEAIGARDTVLVAQSLAGFTTPLVCARVRVRMLVFVNGMIPAPGETAGEWWGTTGSIEARIEAAKRGGYSTDFDLATYFLHDLPRRSSRKASHTSDLRRTSYFASLVGSRHGLPCRST
jgi:hypothetical protein